ncbi:hypothetical protein KUV89_17205 [Marinobacter hydrocarbonoclasticus]|nr:hypothetical protein [Marinobacter nauticus]
MTPKWQWLTLLGVLLSVALLGRAMAEPIGKEAYLAGQATEVVQITPDALRKRLADGEAITVLDVRSLYERENGRTVTEQEIHIPRGFLEFKAWNTLPKDRPIVVYCGTGARSKLAADTLTAMGWDNVSSLEGGITAFYESVGEDCGCVDLPF